MQTGATKRQKKLKNQICVHQKTSKLKIQISTCMLITSFRKYRPPINTHPNWNATKLIPKTAEDQIHQRIGFHQQMGTTNDRNQL
jgi:hypothetical protein